MQLTRALHSAANSTPDRVATEYSDRSTSWGELKHRVARLAGALRGLGVCEGDRIGLLALNSDLYIEVIYAIWWCGAVLVPMNTRWSVAEHTYSLNDSGVTVLFVGNELSAVIAEIQKQSETVQSTILIDSEETPDGVLAYQPFLDEAQPVQDSRKGGEDLAGIFYTGGTTGLPKGVMLPHRSLWFNGLIGAKQLQLEAGDRYLHAAPMFHVADMLASLAATTVGATHLFLPVFTPKGIVDVIEQTSATHTLLVPTMMGMMLDDADFNPQRLSSLKYILYGASPMPEGLLRRLLKTLPATGFVQGYGQTEMAPLITVLSAFDHRAKGNDGKHLCSAGRPVLGVEIVILDEDGREVPKGTVGEIVVSGPGTMQGYWNLPEQTESALVNGAVRTGDGAYMDEDGYVYIVDRLKDMIVSGGENVFSAEVENIISQLPGVAQVAVIGVPSQEWGESVHAIVVPSKNSSIAIEDIMDHCQDSIARYKCPRSIEIRHAPLPLSGPGKILKRELRLPFWKHESKSVG
ncbi:MAG: long-chain fatty acid--CoA ligase [Gammaproteobacteria bacterium]|nr:long-chain fatty acid--CoA ligase [Gammaproteobacteria bacterium]